MVQSRGEYLIALGSLIREERVRLGWSQNELSRQSGVTQATISRLERGQEEIGIYVYRRLLSALGLELVVVPIDA